MVNNKNPIKIMEQLLVVSSLQLIFAISFKSAVIPSFFLIWLLIITWDGNTEISLVLAFVAGIIHDLISRGTLGTTSIRFLILIYINSFLKIKNLSAKVAATFFFSFLFFISILFEPAKGFLWNIWPLVKYSLIFCLYNSIILYFLELIMRRYRWKQKKDYLVIS